MLLTVLPWGLFHRCNLPHYVGVYLGQRRQLLRQSVGLSGIENLTCFGFLQQLQCSLRVLAALLQVGNDLTLSPYALAPKCEVRIHLQEVLFKSLSVHAMTHAATAVSGQMEPHAVPSDRKRAHGG
jgi:hypothetical protein